MPSVHAMKSAVLEAIYQLSCAHKLPIDVVGFPSTFKQSVVKCWTIVWWKQEGRAPVVLTIDGASRGNPGLSASGGILSLLVLLQIAEADGLAKGISLCLSLGHYMVDIQSDSLVFLDFSLQHIRYLLKQLDYQLDHIFRERNKVADCLANYDYDSAKTQQFLSYSSLPKEARGFCFFDKLSVPDIRCIKGA
ncbi:hypothetical protein M9H77_11535 [Catharanthus roseus]|uniref:Uncharacterized protein n=1 Tax=Catharanthus roseus TaxID=4058 RepID=A0ACC0BEW9_CATRO|nr:hypothetical protein M9H77_11535 [Catharanthus roseus]